MEQIPSNWLNWGILAFNKYGRGEPKKKKKKKTKNSILITWIEISGAHAAFMKWVINGED
jgi:hypothetical protein